MNNLCEAGLKEPCSAENQALHVNVKSFNILKAITDTNFFSKVDLSPTARLIMFSLANMYNPKKGFVYPKNNKLMKCTGSGERAVSQAVNELKAKGVIVIVFEENFRKIYFTQKTYGFLGVIEKENSEGSQVNEEVAQISEKIGSSVDGKPQIAEIKVAEFGFGEVAKCEGRVAKNAYGVAKNAGTCHEHKKEQIKKQFVKNDFIFLKEKEGVKEVFKSGGYLTDKMQSEIILNGFHRHNVKKDDDFKAILRIKKVWNFKENEFEVLRFIEEKRIADRSFAAKIEKMENDVEFSLIGFEKEIKDLRDCWLNYENRQ
ncbi:MAG: helix-turn-helix domain-containing protein [bacterium]